MMLRIMPRSSSDSSRSRRFAFRESPLLSPSRSVALKASSMPAPRLVTVICAVFIPFPPDVADADEVPLPPAGLPRSGKRRRMGPDRVFRSRPPIIA